MALTECAHTEDYFRECVAERYHESAADMFDSAVVEPVVDFLVELARDGAALEGVEVPQRAWLRRRRR